MTSRAFAGVAVSVAVAGGDCVITGYFASLPATATLTATPANALDVITLLEVIPTSPRESFRFTFAYSTGSSRSTAPSILRSGINQAVRPLTNVANPLLQLLRNVSRRVSHILSLKTTRSTPLAPLTRPRTTPPTIRFPFQAGNLSPV